MNLNFRYALKRLWVAPVFTATAVLMLALGIGMSANTFSITNAIVLAGLPFPEPERLVGISSVSPQSPDLPLAPGNYLDVRDSATCFENLVAYVPWEQNVAELGQPPEAQFGMMVTANFLRALRVQPVLGRDFATDEDQPGKAPVVILTDSYWRYRFNAEAKILGRTLRIGTTNHTVIGVLPPSFDQALLWRGCGYLTNLIVWPGWRSGRTDKWISVCARLKPKITHAQAQAQLAAIAQRLDLEHPTENGKDGLRVAPLASTTIDSGSRRIYWLMLGLSVLVLLIACANLAGLQLARAFVQSHAMAIRAALGASRLQRMAPLLTESIVIAGAGTVLGVMLARWGNDLFAHYNGDAAVPLDTRVFVFVVVVALLTVLTFGFGPAWVSTQAHSIDALRDSSRSSTSGPLQQRLKFALVAGQLALAVVLIIAATSFALGLRSFARRDLGWKPGGLAAGLINIPFEIFQEEDKNPKVVEQMRQALAQIPGVDRAVLMAGVPFLGDPSKRKIVIEGDAPLAPGQEPGVDLYPVGADYFAALKIPLVRGELPPARFHRGDRRVIVINAGMARRFWPNESAIGKRLKFFGETDWNEIAGIVGDVNFTVSLDHAANPMQVYCPVEMQPGIWYSFVLQSPLPAATLLPGVRRAISSVNPDFRLQTFSGLPEILDNFARDPMKLIALSTYAGAGLLIALIGLFGVMVQFTQQRRREIGVRFALGASARHVIGLVLRRGMIAVGGGICIGAIGAIAVQRVYHASMPELPIPGWSIQLAIVAAFVATAIIACFVPAWQATRIDPAEVLRAE
jgi:predicted permease